MNDYSQGGILEFFLAHPPAAPALDRSQCSYAPCLPRYEVRQRHSSAPWLAPVAGSQENTLPTGRASSAVVTTWRLRTSPVTCAGPTRQKRYNVYVLALANDWSCRERDFVRTISDRSLRVTATRAWNSFTASVTSAFHWPCLKDNSKHSCVITLFRDYIF